MVKVIDLLDVSFAIGVDVPHLLELLKEGEYLIAMARLIDQGTTGRSHGGAPEIFLGRENYA